MIDAISSPGRAAPAYFAVLIDSRRARRDCWSIIILSFNNDAAFLLATRCKNRRRKGSLCERFASDLCASPIRYSPQEREMESLKKCKGRRKRIGEHWLASFGVNSISFSLSLSFSLSVCLSVSLSLSLCLSLSHQEARRAASNGHSEVAAEFLAVSRHRFAREPTKRFRSTEPKTEDARRLNEARR